MLLKAEFQQKGSGIAPASVLAPIARITEAAGKIIRERKPRCDWRSPAYSPADTC